MGIAPSTADLLLSLLERSGLVCLPEPWFGNAGKRLILSPKLYWRDTGLLCWLIGIGSEADLARSPLVGAVWETFVVGEVQRQLELAAAAGTLHFWSDRSKEVDLVPSWAVNGPPRVPEALKPPGTNGGGLLGCQEGSRRGDQKAAG